MKTPTLIADRLYYGMEPLRLRDATDRVLARVAGVPPHRATVALGEFAQDFNLGSTPSRAVVDAMVREGLLERLTPSGMDYAITDRFRGLANARVIQPLARKDAQMLVTHLADVAAGFNRTSSANRYEIAALAVHGSYMSLDESLPDVAIGITGRRRPPPARPASGRATLPTEGTAEIRELFERQSSYLAVGFYRELAEVPRPFSVVFRDDG